MDWEKLELKESPPYRECCPSHFDEPHDPECDKPYPWWRMQEANMIIASGDKDNNENVKITLVKTKDLIHLGMSLSYDINDDRIPDTIRSLCAELEKVDNYKKELANIFLQKASECEAEAKKLGKVAGSTAHMCGNVWRAAASIVDCDTVKEKYYGENPICNNPTK